MPPDDETALADALVASANDRLERQRRGVNASLHVERRYSWHGIAQQVSQVYEQALADDGLSRRPSLTCTPETGPG